MHVQDCKCNCPAEDDERELINDGSDVHRMNVKLLPHGAGIIIIIIIIIIGYQSVHKSAKLRVSKSYERGLDLKIL